MTTLITPELRQAIDDARGAPVRLEDPERRAAYVVLSAEEYERLRSIDTGDVEAMYPMIAYLDAEDWEPLSNYDR